MSADFLFWLLAVIAWAIGTLAGLTGNSSQPDGNRILGVNWLCLGLAFAGITMLVG